LAVAQGGLKFQMLRPEVGEKVGELAQLGQKLKGKKTIW